MLPLLGLNLSGRKYRFVGRDFRLKGVHGHVANEIDA